MTTLRRVGPGLCCLSVLCVLVESASAVNGPPSAADFDGDGIVDGLDLGLLLSQWGLYSPCPPYREADLNQDCRVNGIDLGSFLSVWGSVDAPDIIIPPPQLPPGTWQRPFPLSPVPLAMHFQSSGTSFWVDSQMFGVLREDTPGPLFLDAGPLTITTAVQGAAKGFDVVYTISNFTAQSQPLPKLWIRGNKLSTDTVDYLALGFETVFNQLTWTAAMGAITEQNRYPTTRYAPVAVVRDPYVAVGVSVQYPVLEYKHAVSPEFRRYGGIFPDWATYVALDGQIGPGETRTYRVSTRYAKRVDWIHTLEPYRNYIWANYGNQPEYPQDLRPMWGRHQAFAETVDVPENPRGFQTIWEGGYQWRVDLDGWEHEVDQLVAYILSSGYRRTMIWTASGMYNTLPTAPGGGPLVPRFPSRVMTDWLPPMLSTAHELLRIGEAGADFGVWWGDSALVALQWNPQQLHPFDINNPQHVQIMMSQANLAAARGAKTICLDSYRMMPLWTAWEWLDQLQAAHPSIQFGAEPWCADIMHLRIPYYAMTNNLHTAPLLADYLIPGRCIFALLDGQEQFSLTAAARYIGWGLTILGPGQTLTADAMQHYVDMAQQGWVLPWDYPAP